jgi:SAM-dependent methyltransferase
MNIRSETDKHWNERALSGIDAAKINIDDTVQRDLELQFVFKNLDRGSRLLEVGCGNGYVTKQLRERVAFVDAFDFSENMIERGKQMFGETNNRFFHDSVLAPKNARGPYDIVVCIRVLINLRNLEEQSRSVRNIADLVKPGGKVILIEGYREGFEAISAFRTELGIPALKPASINYYSALSELMPVFQREFTIADTFHTGLFDFLTRVVYPSLVGPDQATRAGEFHSKIEPIVRAYDGPDLARFARLHGLLLIKR